MSEFYRNGPIVPSSNPSVPESGAISFLQFNGASDITPTPVTYQIQADTQNLDTYTYATSPQRPAPTRWDGSTAGWEFDFQIGNVRIGSIDSPGTALSVPAQMAQAESVSITNQGTIVGAGGGGGIGQGDPVVNPPDPPIPGGSGTPGSPGGDALKVQAPITLINNKAIGGGGGGGAGGDPAPLVGEVGGAGAGWVTPSPGPLSQPNTEATTSNLTGTQNQTQGGNAGHPSAGAGGAVGQDGQPGTYGSHGQAGKAVVGTSNITSPTPEAQGYGPGSLYGPTSS